MTIPNLNYHHFKAPCRVATAGASIDLSSTTDPGSIDGTSLNDGDRILLKNQSTASENGPYVAVTATDPSTWERAFDANATPLVNAGMTISISEGAENNDTTWQLSTNDPITLGSTELSFSQLGGGGGASGRKWDHSGVFFGDDSDTAPDPPGHYYDVAVYGWPVSAEMKIYKVNCYIQDTYDSSTEVFYDAANYGNDIGVDFLNSFGNNILNNDIDQSWSTGEPLATTTSLPVTAKLYNDRADQAYHVCYHLEYNIVPT